ncbi:MAG: L,D-transpeptidase, partial [Nitratireductor sp.]
PFVDFIPERIQDQRDLKELAFRSIEEALSEKFHMDEAFLKWLNDGLDFSVAGTKIKVASVGRNLDKAVASIKADMNSRWLKAFDKNGNLIASYPASIGSPQNPSPKGSFKVRNKAAFPVYTLSASNTFEKIDDGRSVTVAPGANNPVGIAWIGLSKKSYGIHGTPEPSKVGDAGSHGCIRLTNWDAMELARLVRTGIKVDIQ